MSTRKVNLRKLEGETYVLLKPSWGPDPTIDPPTKLDLSPECWEPWLKRTLLSWGELSSLWAKNSSYCLFMDAETTWNRMSGRRMACLKMLWALEVMQTEMGHGGQAILTLRNFTTMRCRNRKVYNIAEDVCGTGCWCGNISSRYNSNIEEDLNYIIITNINAKKRWAPEHCTHDYLKCSDMSWKTKLTNQQGSFGNNKLQSRHYYDFYAQRRQKKNLTSFPHVKKKMFSLDLLVALSI